MTHNPCNRQLENQNVVSDSELSDDVHVMPNDGTHCTSVECFCRPVEDDETRRLIAQGLPSARVWIHNAHN